MAAAAEVWARAARSISKTVRSWSKTAPLIITVPLAEMAASAWKEAAAELEAMAATPHFATAALILAARAEAEEDQRAKAEIVTVEAEGPFFRGSAAVVAICAVAKPGMTARTAAHSVAVAVPAKIILHGDSKPAG